VLYSAPASRRAGLPLDAICVITTILLIGTVKENCFPIREAACARQNEEFEGGCRHVDALECREDRNRWRNRAVAVDRGGAEEADGNNRGSMVPRDLPQFPRFRECGPLCDGWLRVICEPLPTWPLVGVGSDFEQPTVAAFCPFMSTRLADRPISLAHRCRPHFGIAYPGSSAMRRLCIDRERTSESRGLGD
jgi:hypothetical protein